MAVQAQYPSNALFFNRGVQEGDYQELLQPNMLFSNGATTTTTNPRKRTREADAAATAIPSQPNNLFFHTMIPNQTAMVNLSQLQQNQIVSTGLRLSSENTNFLFTSQLNEELSVQIKQHRDEIHRLLTTQAENLRRVLAEKRQKHYRALLCAAEEAASRRLSETEAEAAMAARRNAELESRVSHLQGQSRAWQARARAQEAEAAVLKAELQRASATGERSPGGVGGDAEDAESAYEDPERVETVGSVPACRACRVRPVSVVVLPCRHLCLCSACDVAAAGAGGAAACPVCLSVRSASVQVFLS
ncbi:hypothetical protein QJS10_CPB20g01333 [Acorus calamus]|uniref:RING-type domain-containing protein n=1 Tax=Acorus calamus TaxID=4465 RepID=A0AAV9CBY6_ACOCL|nr:hypothetical protein QJS10_CPB20g01333 [Acorus calamus]